MIISIIFFILTLFPFILSSSIDFYAYPTLTACPVGTYCPGGVIATPIACPRGTFNNITGSSSCHPCPPGTSCPYAQTIKPTPCPPGYICPDYSTIYPSFRCPAGLICLGGIATPDPYSTVYPENRPILCMAGSYCLNGTGYNITDDLKNGYPHTCEEGVYCNAGASSPLGMGQCSPGYYCPRGAAIPIVTSPGYYASSTGAIKPSVCTPGYFSPGYINIACVVCPAGFKCPNFQMSVANICPRGFYRSLNDSVTCKACSTGKWSPDRALSEGTLCQPCPSGRVCGINGMTSLNDSSICIEGYVCPPGTNPSTQFDWKCPQGYACPPGTTPETMYDSICPQGFYCNEGTSLSLITRLACPNGRYCPSGSYLLNGNYLTACVPSYVTNKTNSPEPCGEWNVTLLLPDGLTNYYHTPNTCPFGSTSSIQAYTLSNCTMDGSGILVQFTMFDEADKVENNYEFETVKYPASAKDELIYVPSFGNATAYHSLPFFTYVSFSIDWSNIAANVPFTPVYGITFDLILYSDNYTNFFPSVSPSGHDVGRIPSAFTDSSNYQLSKFQLSFFTMVPLNFALMVRIFDPLLLPYAFNFQNMANISVSFPSRAVLNTSNMFIGIFDATLATIDIPYNLPFSNQYTYLLGFGTQNTSQSLVNRIYADAYISSTDQLPAYGLPYFPFFSNCRGFGPYIPFQAIFENPQCILIDSSETFPVGDFDFGKTPISDSCNFTTQCVNEEWTQLSGGITRWFEITSKTEIFHIHKKSFTREEIYSNSFENSTQAMDYTLFSNWLLGLNMYSDDFAHVYITRDSDSVSSSGTPTLVEVNIQYQQLSPTEKRIVAGLITMSKFQADKTISDYNLSFTYSAMGWLDLFNIYSLSINIYLVIFSALAIMMLLFSFVIWLFHRIFPRFDMEYTFNILNLSQLIIPGCVVPIGLILSVAFAFIYIADDMLKASTSAVANPLIQGVADVWNYNFSISPASATAEQINLGRAQRLGVIICSIGLYFIFLGSEMLIPYKIKLRFNSADEDKDDDKTGNDKKIKERVKMEKAHQEPDNEGFSPRYWKRVAYAFLCMAAAFGFNVCLGFSYGTTYGSNSIALSIFFKLLQPFVEIGLVNLVGEALLAAPILALYCTMQLTIAMGADSFLYFLIIYSLFFTLSIFQTIYYEPYIKENFSSWIKSVRKAMIHIGLQKMNDDDRAEAKAQRDTRDGRVKTNIESNKPLGLVEPLLESQLVMSCETIGLCMLPLFLSSIQYLLLVLPITKNFGIADLAINYYLTFITIMIGSNFLIKIVVINALEVVQGWKCYEYLAYLNFRFESRLSKWKAFEINTDNQLPMSLRSLDTLCFSSQYYIVVVFPTVGMLLLSIGMEMLVLNPGVNPFGDAISLVLFFRCIFIIKLSIGFTFITGYILKSIAIYFSNYFNIYHVAPKAPRKKEENKERAIPNWQRLAAMKSMFGGNEAMMLNIDTARLSDEAFRHRFVDIEENRFWIAENLPIMLTPRFLVSTASTLASNISQALVKANKWRRNLSYVGEVNENEISDDDSDDEDVAAVRFKQTKGLEGIVSAVKNVNNLRQVDVTISPESATDLSILKLWHFWIRRRQKLADRGLQLLKRIMSDECDICHDHLIELKSIPNIPINNLVTQFEVLLSVVEEPNFEKWENFYLSRQNVSTICIACYNESDNNFGPQKTGKNLISASRIAYTNDAYDIHIKNNPLNALDKAIAKMWLSIARQAVLLKKNARKVEKFKSRIVTEISSDSDQECSDSENNYDSFERKPNLQLHLPSRTISEADEDDDDLMLTSFRPADLDSYRHPRPPQVQPLPLSKTNFTPYMSIPSAKFHFKKDFDGPIVNNADSMVDQTLLDVLQNDNSAAKAKSSIQKSKLASKSKSAVKYEISDDSD